LIQHNNFNNLCLMTCFEAVKKTAFFMGKI